MRVGLVGKTIGIKPLLDLTIGRGGFNQGGLGTLFFWWGLLPRFGPGAFKDWLPFRLPFLKISRAGGI